jgi:hypothetical protein
MDKGPLTAAQRERLKQTLASGSSLGASDLRLLNIDLYKQRLGSDWFKYKGIIQALAVAAIKSELGADDFYVETNGGYGVFFFKKSIAEVQVISDRMASRLERELSREPAFGDPPLECKAASVSCDQLLRQLEHDSRPPAPTTPAATLTHERAAATLGAIPSAYAPLWHSKMERVLGSLFTRVSPPPLRPIADKDYFEPNQAQALQDVSSFGAMLSDAYKLHKAGQSTTIIFSLNFPTFCTPEFHKEYLVALRQTPASLVQYLTPRFVRIPPGTPQGALASKVHILGTIFKHVVLHTRPVVDMPSFEFVPCSILATSWMQVTAAADARRPASAVIKQFCQSARLLHLNSLVTNVDTPAALDATLAAGPEFISGAAVCSAAKAPFAQRPVPLDDLSAKRGGAPGAQRSASTA